MSTMVIYSSQSKAVLHLGVVVLIAIAIALVTWIALRIATRVGGYMSMTTVNVATRIMGLLLAALAVEIFAGGIVELIPALGKPDVFRYGQ
jgi:multiple antibiotic resistance protein